MTGPVIHLPAQTITMGIPWPALFRLEDTTADDPYMDLTGYTVAWALSTKPFETPFATGTGTIGSDSLGDFASIEISETVTATFGDYALPIIGGRPSAVMQIDLTAPVAANSYLIQGPVIIQGKF